MTLRYPDAPSDGDKAVTEAEFNLAEARAEIERLRDALEQFVTAPSGVAICACHNINAVKAGMERPCAYCVARAALAPEGEGE